MLRLLASASLVFLLGCLSCSSSDIPAPYGGAGKGGAGGAKAGPENGGSGTSGGTASNLGGEPGLAGSGEPAGASGGGEAEPGSGLSWPIDCVPNETCSFLGYPDADKNGEAFDCGRPGYLGHEGTDIAITEAAMDAGVSVRAAADGVVWFVADGKFDRCPDANEPDCQNPRGLTPGAQTGTTVCTELGPYCQDGQGRCFWCFAGGNVVVILHEGQPGVFATRYDHLKKDSILVKPGEAVKRGQVIAQVGSAGNSTGPHLHFEVWGTSYYDVVEPWAGECGPNFGPSLWAQDPAWD